MTDVLRISLERLLRNAEIEQDVDFLRQGVKLRLQALMEIEFEQHLGAGRHERTTERSGYRNGHREREWETRLGTIDLQVPWARDSGFYPPLLRAAPPRRERVGGGPGGIRPGRLDQESRCAGQGTRDERDQQESGLASVRRT